MAGLLEGEESLRLSLNRFDTWSYGFDTIHERDRRTGRHRTTAPAPIASRGTNGSFHIALISAPPCHILPLSVTQDH